MAACPGILSLVRSAETLMLVRVRCILTPGERIPSRLWQIEPAGRAMIAQPVAERKAGYDSPYGLSSRLQPATFPVRKLLPSVLHPTPEKLMTNSQLGVNLYLRSRHTHSRSPRRRFAVAGEGASRQAGA